MNVFKKLEDSVSTILALVSLIGVVFGIYFYNEGRYAIAENVNKELKQTQEQVQKVIERLDIKILNDRADNLQQRIWKLEDRYGVEKKMPYEVKEEFRKLKQEKGKLDKELERLNK